MPRKVCVNSEAQCAASRSQPVPSLGTHRMRPEPSQPRLCSAAESEPGHRANWLERAERSCETATFLVREIHRKVLKQSKFPLMSRPISYIMLTTNWIRFAPVASLAQRLFPAWALLSPFRDPASGNESHPGDPRLAPEGGILSQPS